MRDLLVVAVFGVGILYAFRNPFIGLLVYFWISVMNPHRYTWGFAYDLPLAKVAALATLLSIMLNSGQTRFPRTRESVMLLVLWIWVTITTSFAFYPDVAWEVWKIVTKIFLMTFVAMMLITTRKRLIYFLLALVGFLGFIGIKGAAFGVLTRGQYKVWGPPESFIKDNNSVGLALVILIPFCFFLRDYVNKKWQSYALLGTGFAMITSAILTYSRGALLGLVASGAFYLRYTQHKFRIALVGAVLLAVGLSVMPSTWFDRMATIRDYKKDGSANSRINSWTMAFNLARENPLGGGFSCFTMDQYYNYAPDPELGRTASGAGSTAHSIYFEVLAMHGFIGLAIFLTTIGFTFLSMFQIERLARRSAGGQDIILLSRALRISMVGFVVSGAFLSRAFFDLFWAIFAAATSFRYMVLNGEWEGEELDEADKPEEVHEGRAVPAKSGLARQGEQ